LDITGITVEYRIVDVFADRPLAGNALCVVLDPVPEPVMQALAREVNLSETTFPVVVGEAEYENRIFTPAAELPFAGHPTLGTAFVLGPNRWTQRTSGATVVVEADETGAVMTQPDPSFTETDAVPAVRALGLAGADGAWIAQAAGNRHLLVLADQPIHRLEPDPVAVATVSKREDAFTVAVIERRADDDLHVRVFVPGAGIPEDAGTGSAAGPIGVLARQQWGTAPDVVVHQGLELGRPCRIEVHAELGAIRVGGRVAQCGKGHFSL
jgi:trans-2,3-dihydro-3-hydroxyanthranilate isomerase